MARAPKLALFALVVAASVARGQQVVKPGAERDPSQLPPPAGLLATQVTANEIVLTWTKAAGATGYRVFGPPLAAGSPLRLLGTIGGSGTRWVVPITTAMRSGGPLQFAIQSIGLGGAASDTARFNVVTVAGAVPGGRPAPPTNVVATVGSDGRVTLTWTGVPGATAYNIGRAVQPNGYRTICVPCAPVARFVDSATVAGSVHSYSVATVSPGGVSLVVLSNAVTPGAPTLASGDTTPTSGGGSATSGPPPTPAGLQLVASGSVVQLSWKPSPGATSYRVTRDRSCGGGVLSRELAASAAGDTLVRLTDEVGVHTTPLECRAPGPLTVEYRVAAANALGSSTAATTGARSLGWQAPPAPVPASADRTASGDAALAWNASAGAMGYVVTENASCNSISRVSTRWLGAPAGGSAPTQTVMPLSQTLASLGCPVGGSVAARYAVRAVGSLGLSGDATFAAMMFSNTTPYTGGTTPTGSAPPPVTGVKLAFTDGNTAVLTWTASPGATSYRVERLLGTGVFAKLADLPGTVTGFADYYAGLAKLNPQYRVSAINAYGSSGPVSVAP